MLEIVGYVRRVRSHQQSACGLRESTLGSLLAVGSQPAGSHYGAGIGVEVHARSVAQSASQDRRISPRSQRRPVGLAGWTSRVTPEPVRRRSASLFNSPRTPELCCPASLCCGQRASSLSPRPASKSHRYHRTRALDPQRNTNAARACRPSFHTSNSSPVEYGRAWDS
jgi:hypothetical protein